MVPIELIEKKIEMLKVEISLEKNLRNKELLEERIIALEELVLETINKDNK